MIEIVKQSTGKAWTHFWDMHSGGGLKTEWHHIFIEAPREEAERIFTERTGEDPDDVACTCCGSNFTIAEYETLEEATEFQRKGWRGDKVTPLEEYVQQADVLVIRRGQ